MTGMYVVARFGLKDMMILLIRRGQLPDTKDSSNRTPLSLAAWYGHEAVVKQLVERDDVVADSKDNDGRTLLSWAAAKGYKAIVKLLY
jgi:ankyrin repeat protein